MRKLKEPRKRMPKLRMVTLVGPVRLRIVQEHPMTKLRRSK